MQMDQAEKSTLSKRCVPVYTKPPLLAPKTLFGVPQGCALGPICFHCWLVFTAEAVISTAADEARTSRRTITSASRPPKTHTGTFYAYADTNMFSQNDSSVTVTLAWVSTFTFWNLSSTWNEYGPKRRLGGRWFVSSISLTVLQYQDFM